MNTIKNTLKKVPLMKKYWNLFNNIKNINRRLEYLEKRVHNHRWYAIELAADYLVGAQVEGDYCEFGVYKGETFGHMLRYENIFPSMRFFAFDSFQGLPEPKGIDSEGGYTSNFHHGEFSFSKDDFFENLKSKKLNIDKVSAIEGWFDDTLNSDTSNKHNIKKIACAWIDCDLYESTVPVLDFLTDKLSIGSLIIFDDWKVYRNLADKGGQRATSEWLKKNQGLEISQIFDFANNGRAFTVAKLPDSATQCAE